jgi:cysteine desulfurase/selenocysteine lyase
MSTTNVRPDSLNYNSYTGNQYDRDIARAIPFYAELHEEIVKFVRRTYSTNDSLRILDLGVGTGITSKLLRDIFPNASFDVFDFADNMLESARKRLGSDRVQYICADYAEHTFEDNAYDIVVTVIGLHHQNTQGKKNVLKKIHATLKPGGVFILGDLVTHQDKEDVALNQAKHFHHLVDNAVDEQTLREWAYHHLYLNDLAPKEDLYAWIQETGFETDILLQKINTCLLVGKKPVEKKEKGEGLFSERIQNFMVDTSTLGRTRYVNFDNAATTPPLRAVEQAVETFMEQYGSVHRGAGTKSQLSTDAYEHSRSVIKDFVNAPGDSYVIFSNNTTGGMNMLAHFFSFLPGKIAVSAIEHSSSWLPWITQEGIKQLGTGRTMYATIADDIQKSGKQFVLSYDVNDRLEFSMSDIEHVLSENRIKALVVTASSNITGYCPDLLEIGKLCKQYGAYFIVDACQFLQHHKLDMTALGIDFLIASGHKFYAPYGGGFVVGPKHFFDQFLPYQIGGGNIDYIDKTGTFSFTKSNLLHDPGTPNAVGAVAMATALDTLSRIGMELIHAHEYRIAKKIFDALVSNEHVIVYTKPEHLNSIVTFTIPGQSAEETARTLNDEYGIGVRAGNFCVYRVIRELTGGNEGIVRISVGLCNTMEDADRVIYAISHVTRQYQIKHT